MIDDGFRSLERRKFLSKVRTAGVAGVAATLFERAAFAAVEQPWAAVPEAVRRPECRARVVWAAYTLF